MPFAFLLGRVGVGFRAAKGLIALISWGVVVVVVPALGIHFFVFCLPDEKKKHSGQGFAAQVQARVRQATITLSSSNRR
jgi:hypothetical protein